MTIQVSSYSSRPIADIFMGHGVDSKGITKSKQVIKMYIFMYVCWRKTISKHHTSKHQSQAGKSHSVSEVLWGSYRL